MVRISSCQTPIDSYIGELEMNFGEYEFVYPDGEVDSTPTTGQSVQGLESDHEMILEDRANTDCSCHRCP